ncbi:ABC transporter substrate-binding protein [Pseudohongiella spirulinae]|uniref:Branched-chain amino acid ABC transporter substrate-binding protein n=1 Tax=Pseudohongiella spirulinae TaxID=1249552 RepID=A0A0S2KA11_9GAMM|nr:ABC transporter substrate-binding protein [Pseudohongiella spirulinae]ALO44981.1 Branched-chain amino acid ABC transporter substrate-binding protein [Pseudohongiella spirulinae]
MKQFSTLVLAGLLTACGGSTEQSVRGVTDTEVVVGGNHDMSGPFATFSVPAVRAAQQLFNEVNANGGIHGRTIRYIVEDHAYQVPRAVQNNNKLVQNDNVFAMLLSLGTPHNLASFPLMDRNNVPSIMPLALSGQMLTEGDFSRRFAFGADYYQAVSAGIDYLVDEHNIQNLCVMYIPSDFGEEVNRAAQDAVADNPDLTLAASTSHRQDESDFSGALSRLRAANCELVALAVAVRPIMTIASTARDMGWDDVRFIVSQAGFHTVIAQAPGGVTDGIYAASAWPDIEERRDNPETMAWINAYQSAHNEFPSTGAVLGRIGAEAFVRGLEAAGPDLTLESFLAGMESLDYHDPVTGVDVLMSADKHAATSGIVISQIRNGGWQTIEVMEQ